MNLSSCFVKGVVVDGGCTSELEHYAAMLGHSCTMLGLWVGNGDRANVPPHPGSSQEEHVEKNRRRKATIRHLHPQSTFVSVCGPPDHPTCNSRCQHDNILPGLTHSRASAFPPVRVLEFPWPTYATGWPSGASALPGPKTTPRISRSGG